jgi:hypothetical protein
MMILAASVLWLPVVSAAHEIYEIDFGTHMQIGQDFAAFIVATPFVTATAQRTRKWRTAPHKLAPRTRENLGACYLLRLASF